MTDLRKADADQLGVLIALPLSTPAAARIRRVLAATGATKRSRGSRSSGRRGPASSNRGGAVTGSSLAASPLQLVGRSA